MDDLLRTSKKSSSTKLFDDVTLEIDDESPKSLFSTHSIDHSLQSTDGFASAVKIDNNNKQETQQDIETARNDMNHTDVKVSEQDV